MIKTENLIDDKTSYSTTRWAFVVAMKFAIGIAVASFVAFIVFRILKIDTEGLFSGVATVSGVVVGLATTAKALQGFEVKGNIDKPSEHDKEPEHLEHDHHKDGK